MRRAFQVVLLASSLSASLPVVARAHSRDADQGSFFVRDRGWFSGRHWLYLERVHGPLRDPNAAGAAFTLLVGSVAVLAGKRRKDP